MSPMRGLASTATVTVFAFCNSTKQCAKHCRKNVKIVTVMILPLTYIETFLFLFSSPKMPVASIATVTVFAFNYCTKQWAKHCRKNAKIVTVVIHPSAYIETFQFLFSSVKKPVASIATVTVFAFCNCI
jgi:hypothetical protein